MVDLKCPKCNSENTQVEPMKVFNKDVKEMWWMIVILSILGIAIHPVVLFFAFVVIAFLIIVNIILKIRYRNKWSVRCNRCGYEFSVDKPGKESRTENIVAESRTENYLERKTEIADGRADIAEETNFAVELTDTGLEKDRIIKTIRIITGLGLSQAREMTENIPVVVKDGISREEAENIKKELESAGARVDLKQI